MMTILEYTLNIDYYKIAFLLFNSYICIIYQYYCNLDVNN